MPKIYLAELTTLTYIQGKNRKQAVRILRDIYPKGTKIQIIRKLTETGLK